jgi:hypothetical protein
LYYHRCVSFVLKDLLEGILSPPTLLPLNTCEQILWYCHYILLSLMTLESEYGVGGKEELEKEYFFYILQSHANRERNFYQGMRTWEHLQFTHKYVRNFSIEFPFSPIPHRSCFLQTCTHGNKLKCHTYDKVALLVSLENIVWQCI